MALFGSNAIGIDLGCEFTQVYLPGVGVALAEPTRVLVSAINPQDVLAVGDEAKALLGRTADQVELISPVVGGAVADVDMAALIMVALSEKATGRKKALDKGTLVLGAHSGLTRVERAAALQAMSATGARRMATVRTAVAAAIGAGIDIAQPKGHLMMVIGGGTTEIAVLSVHSVVATRFMRLGSQAMDEAIVNWFWRERGIVIGLRTAEQLKIDLGTALTDDDEEMEPVLLKGREAKSGKPVSIEIDRQDIRSALETPIRYLVDALRHALSNLPPELAGDILETGITLAGGGALLHGLAERLELETGLPAAVCERTSAAVALGIGSVASDERLFRALAAAGTVSDAG